MNHPQLTKLAAPLYRSGESHAALTQAGCINAGCSLSPAAKFLVAVVAVPHCVSGKVVGGGVPLLSLETPVPFVRA
jgi:hypothetical protein